jgi:hypothetical protein
VGAAFSNEEQKMAKVTFTVTKEEVFTIRSALRILISDLTVDYDKNPTKEKLEEISKVEKIAKKLGVS